MGRIIIGILVIIIALISTSIFAQEINEDAINIYLDCQTSCDRDYIKTEIAFVNYVRDKEQSEVHILITSQSAGNGGREYTLTFYGKNGYTGVNDTLRFVTQDSDTDDMVRNEMARVLKLGLIKYVSSSPLADKIKISYAKPKETIKTVDKWNGWVFSIEESTWLDGQKSRSEVSFWGEIEASKITEKLKFQVELYGNYNEDSWDSPYTEYDPNGTVVDTLYKTRKRHSYKRSRGFSGQIVPSLSKHWSYQFHWNVYSNMYQNKEFLGYIANAIEYNIYPYTESTRRQLRISYQIVGAYAHYYQPTIYNKKYEWLTKQSFRASLDFTQTWGDAGITFSASNYFHDLDFYRLQLYGNCSIRIFEGFSVNMNAGYSRINDQVNLAAGNMTTEDILNYTRELKTSYDYWASFGFSFSFGSIYNNVVNSRFGTSF